MRTCEENFLLFACILMFICYVCVSLLAIGGLGAIAYEIWKNIVYLWNLK